MKRFKVILIMYIFLLFCVQIALSVPVYTACGCMSTLYDVIIVSCLCCTMYT